MNVLTDPLFRVETDTGRHALNLPQLLAALGRDAVQHFTGMQRHQADAFHVFLSYLAGAVLARRSDTDPVQSENYWREGLRRLSGTAGDDAWTLIVDASDRAAFLQPPIPAADSKKLQKKAATPDELDLLVTAKNHDVKRQRAVHGFPDEWIYALVNLQTMSGYPGKGNPEISRMNGGYGNRSIVEVVRSFRPGQRWQDAVRRLLAYRPELLAADYGYSAKGLVLVWLESWDGETSLPLTLLDPFYVEVCRRVRLRRTDSGIQAEAVPSGKNRVDAKFLRGAVGDAWLPIDLEGSETVQALTLSPQGLTPHVLRRVLFADQLKLTPLQRPEAQWKGDIWLTASVLVRGQGRTEGFHDTQVRIPAPVQRRLFGPSSPQDPLATLSRSAIEYAAKMQRDVLRRAIFVYLAGGSPTAQFDRDSAQAWWMRFARQFESLWSADYFPWLWTAENSLDAALGRWALLLRDHALTVLNSAEKALPRHAGRTYRSHVEAHRTFWRALYHKNHFPFLFVSKGGKA